MRGISLKRKVVVTTRKGELLVILLIGIFVFNHLSTTLHNNNNKTKDDKLFDDRAPKSVGRTSSSMRPVCKYLYGHFVDDYDSKNVSLNQEEIHRPPADNWKFSELHNESSFPNHHHHYYPSRYQIWENFRMAVKEFTIQLSEQFVGAAHGHPEITRDVERYIKFIAYARSKRSLVHPMNEIDSQKLLDIVDKRIRLPEANPPLRIVVLGGSVVTGYEAGTHSWSNTKQKHKQVTQSEAAWPNRLEQMLNRLVFKGRKVVEVTNMAMAGTSSDVAVLPIEYGQFPVGYPRQGPDVIIMAFGANDVSGNMDGPIELIQATKKLRCDGFPILIYYEDLRVGDDSQMHYYRIISELSRWHDIMGISYMKALNDVVYSSLENSNDTISYSLPWFWGPSGHPGLLYHFFSATFIAFNILQSLFDACEDEDAMDADINSKQQPSPMLLNEGLSIFTIPSLIPGTTRFEVQKKWKGAQMAHDEKCNKGDFIPGNSCTYGWLSNKVAGIPTKHHVKAALSSVLVDNTGWDAEGFPIRKPRPGWVASQPGASFTIQVPVGAAATAPTSPDGKIMPIKFVSIVYLKSYGDKWKDSKLLVKLEMLSDATQDDGPPANASSAATASSVTAVLSGIHNSTTSVNYIEKIRLPGDGAFRQGEVVKAMFQLSGGSTFRINGLFFCAM